MSRRAEQEWLTDGAPLMLGQALGQFQDLHVVTEEQLAAARRRLGPREIADTDRLPALAEATGCRGWHPASGR